MGPFVNISTHRPGRFTDGTFGIYSAGDSEEMAIREVAHHHGRALVSAIDIELHDLRNRAEFYAPTSCVASQAFSKGARCARSKGLVYRSVRCPGGKWIAIFWPNVIPLPI